MPLFMGIDIGTSSAKAAVIDERGDVLALGKSEYDLICQHSGWSEQHPETWWDGCRTAVRAALQALGRPAREIRAVGVSNQMHSLVVLDRDGNCVRPSILHNDSRTGKQAAELRALLGEGAEQKTLNPIYTGMTLSALLWIRENEPENYQRIAHALLAGDYVRYRLTGSIATDHSNASATLMYDFHRADWSEEILGAAGIPRALLPACRNSLEIAGTVSARASEETGLAPGTSVVFGGGDQVMQSIGSGSIRPGDATVNIGSGGQVCVQTEKLVSNPSAGVNTFASYQSDKWYLMGANSNGGSAFKWFREGILEEDYAQVDAEVSRVRPGSDGLIFLPYLSGERCPHRNADLSGAFWGLTHLTDRARMTRAAMEGITFSLLDCLRACQSSGVSPDSLIALGGGANSREWLQMQADVFNLPIRTTASKEQAVLGAAIAAAVGVGHFSSCEEGCRAAVRYRDEGFVPRAREHEAYTEYYVLYRDLYRLARPALERVTRLGRRATPSEGARA